MKFTLGLTVGLFSMSGLAGITLRCKFDRDYISISLFRSLYVDLSLTALDPDSSEYDLPGDLVFSNPLSRREPSLPVQRWWLRWS